MTESRYHRTLPVVLALVSFMNYTDRMVLPAVAQSIKVEFGLTDTQLGLLNGFAFVVLYGVASIPLARLADRTSRSLVLAGALAFWSLATAACGFARNFAQLVVARACVGIGESACQPVGYALVSEQFPPQQRNTAMGWFLFGNNVGIVAGFALGGWIGAQYGWRTAFIAVGLPGLLIALALAQFRRPPQAATHSAPPQSPFVETLRVLWRNRTYRYLVLLGGVFSMTVFGPISFLPAFFVRSHGLPMSVVGLYTGLAIGGGMALGVLWSGRLADRLNRDGAERPQWLCAGAILASGLAFAAALLLPDPNVAFVAVFVGAVFGSFASPIIPSAIQNEAPPELRATAAAFGTLFVSLTGIGLAPLIVGLLSDLLSERLGTESLRYALLISLGFCLLTAALHYHVGRLLQAPRPVVTAG